jgi:hypothetical protein
MLIIFFGYLHPHMDIFGAVKATLSEVTPGAPVRQAVSGYIPVTSPLLIRKEYWHYDYQYRIISLYTIIN